MDEWTVVSRKRGAGRRLAAQYLNSASAHPTVSADEVAKAFQAVGIVDNEEEQQKLLRRVQSAVVKVEQSSFYAKFMEQMVDLQVMPKLMRGGEEVEMIVYGVGSLHNSEISRCQLALALLIKQKFISIGRVLVYDPVMFPMECRVMKTLGFEPLDGNDAGRRPITGSTLFFMPHNELELYENVIKTCLDPFMLNRIVIVGNSFKEYKERWTSYPLPQGDVPSSLLRVEESVEEVPVFDDFYPAAFNDTSWHLFFSMEAEHFF